MRFCILASGSKANAAVIEGPHGAILIDCGLNRKVLLSRLAQTSVSPLNLKAILITHEHTDHISGLGVVTRYLQKLDNRIPVYSTAPTRDAAGFTEESADIMTLSAFEQLTVAGIDITTFSTAHDVADPIGFRFECEGESIGYATDTGYLTAAAMQTLRGCDVLAIETNHDPRMLQTGPYPQFLKHRISSDLGHLSNAQAADSLEDLLAEKTRVIVGMHLSQTNNEPHLPAQMLRRQLDQLGHPAKVLISSQFQAMRVL